MDDCERFLNGVYFVECKRRFATAGEREIGLRDRDEIKSVPYVPVSHPFVERLIGTIRREYLDRAFFWNAGT